MNITNYQISYLNNIKLIYKVNIPEFYAYSVVQPSAESDIIYILFEELSGYQLIAYKTDKPLLGSIYYGFPILSFISNIFISVASNKEFDQVLLTFLENL